MFFFYLCCRFIFLSIFRCFLSSTSGCSLFWSSQGLITDPHSIKKARPGASNNSSQNQFVPNDKMAVPVVRIIKSFTCLQFLWEIHQNDTSDYKKKKQLLSNSTFHIQIRSRIKNDASFGKFGATHECHKLIGCYQNSHGQNGHGL